MKNSFSFLAAFCVLIFALFCGSTTAIAQQATARVVRADINGNQFHMYLDHDSLQSLIDRTMGAMDANGNGTLLQWADALTNGNNPGMNVNYNGFSVFGIDSLTSTGLLTADSLILHKDAAITGKLSLGDSLAVAGAAALDSTLSIAGYTRVNDSLYVQKDATFASTVHVTDSLVVAGGTDLNGTLDVTGATGVDGDLDVNTDKFNVASATGNTAIAGTLDVTGDASVSTFDSSGETFIGNRRRNRTRWLQQEL